MNGERGSVTIWMLGLSVVLLMFGGLAVDFWRALALQRELAAIADSAAVAAASGIDEGHYRLTGDVLIEPARASALGSAYVLGQDVDLAALAVVTADDGSTVTVRVVDELQLGLLGLFVDQTEPLVISAEATSVPVLVP